jgi:hypothetical protein
MAGDGINNTLNNTLGQQSSQIIALIQDLRRDVTKRLDDLDAKFDLQEQHRTLTARIDKLDEYRTTQIERQYQALLGVATRADDATVETLRDDKRDARAQQSSLRSGITRWQIAIVGWIIVLALWAGDQLAVHWH